MRNIAKEMMHTLYALITFKMRCKFLILFVVVALAAFLCPRHGTTEQTALGEADSFAVLGAAGVTNATAPQPDHHLGKCGCRPSCTFRNHRLSSEGS